MSGQPVNTYELQGEILAALAPVLKRYGLTVPGGLRVAERSKTLLRPRHILVEAHLVGAS